MSLSAVGSIQTYKLGVNWVSFPKHQPTLRRNRLQDICQNTVSAHTMGEEGRTMQKQIADITSGTELFEKYEKLAQSHNLVLVSNRGPLEYRPGPNGDFQARRGSGVVVTALNTILENFPFTWIANAMGEGDRKASEAAAGEVIPSPLPNQKVSVRFVVTSRRTYHKFYNIFCNPLLWFLQHQMWSAPYTPNIDTAVHDAWNTGYTTVNQALAETLIEEANKSEKRPVIIIHDYHLYLVGGMARKQLPDALIYHYIHIPWPATRNWQQLPAEIRTSICESLASCDLVGFQSGTDVTNFLQSCETFIPGCHVDYASKIVEVGGHQTMVAAYPMSIDIAEIRNIGESTRTMEHQTNIQSLLCEFTLVRVDRAEPNKNIIRGFSVLLSSSSATSRITRQSDIPGLLSSIPNSY